MQTFRNLPRIRDRRSTAKTVAALLLALAAQPSNAATHEAGPQTFRETLASAGPGDTILLAPGKYSSSLSLENKHGTATAPIVVQGAPDHASIFVAQACCNTVQLKDSSYIEIRGLMLDGDRTDGAFAVDARGITHHVTVEDLRIVNYGAQQQVVGISTKGPAWNWTIRRNLIASAGTGMYLGNSDGTAPFVNGIIEYNVILDSLGYNLQIKHQLKRPVDVGLPPGTHATLIRHNVFSKVGNYSTGENARPNVLIGHSPLSGAGMDDRYEIYGNFFYQNPTDALLQAEGNLVIHDNLMVNAGGSAIHLRPHEDVPREIAIYHNTILARDSGIRISGPAPTAVQRIVGNAVYAAAPIVGPGQANNVTGTYAEAADALTAPFAPIGNLDLSPQTGKLSGPAIALNRFGRYTDGARDFDGRERDGTTRGAYAGAGAGRQRPLLQGKPEVKASGNRATSPR